MKNFYILFVLLIQAFAFGQTTTNILNNGNFHDCNQNWEIYGDFTYACGDDFYTHYNFSYGYGYNLQIDHAFGVIEQVVAFPDNITEVELELYHKITTEEINNSEAYDKLFIKLVSNSETYVVAVLSNEDYSSTYIHKTYNIPSNLFEDETVTLEFTVDNDGLKPTRFRVDDISLNVTTSSNSSNLSDLQVLNPVLEETNVYVGDVINISCDVTEVNNEDCSSSKLRYYLSNDNTFSTDDHSFGSDNVSSLNGLESDNEDKDITIPNVSNGVYYILFVADADEEIEESNENNNITVVAITVNTSDFELPDLQALNPTLESYSVQVNEVINISCDVTIVSGDVCGSSKLRYYLSNDITLSADDISVGSDDVSSLNTGESNNEDKNITIPNVPSGAYYILFVVDSDEEIEESIESNNTTAIAIAIANDSNASGTLKIAINPPDAVNNGAKWRVESGDWLNHNQTISLAVGTYTVDYKTISGYNTPNSETVSIYESVTTNLTRTYEENFPIPSITIKYPRGAGVYNGFEQYYDDAYVAGVKIRVLAELEYVPTNSNIELWYSLNDGNTWYYSGSFQGGYTSGSSVLDVEWYCDSGIDSKNVKVKFVLNSNGQTIEAANNGVFEIHPQNKYTNSGFKDDGVSVLENPFAIDEDMFLALGNTNIEGGHICFDHYSMDYNILKEYLIGSPINATCNQPFYSPLEGVILFVDKDLEPNCQGSSGVNSGSGNQVIIQSNIDKTKAFRILHLNYVDVSVGDYVNIGDYLGDLGSTGEFTTGAHAHTSLYKNIYVSSAVNSNNNELYRFIDYLSDDEINFSLNSTNCQTLKNNYSAPFDFLINLSENNDSKSSLIISNIENSEYLIFIPEKNVNPDIKIFDQNGVSIQVLSKTKMEESENGSSRKINMNEFANGIYFITIQSETMLYSHKIIKI